MKTTISDFTFVFVGYGHYKVTYRSPITRKEFTHTTNNMQLIDNTKNCDNPKQCELECLKRMCKQ